MLNLSKLLEVFDVGFVPAQLGSAVFDEVQVAAPFHFLLFKFKSKFILLFVHLC